MRRLPLLRLLPLLLFGFALFDSSGAGADEATVFPLSLLNGIHTNLAPDLAPIKRGPVTVRIESPSHRVAVHRNQLTLRATEDGLVAADFEVDFEGEGQLIANLEAVVSSRLEDEVVIPRQTLQLSGLIRLRPAEDGYWITLVEMPATVQVTIESKLLRQLVDLCEGFSGFLPVSCDGLAEEASRATIPMPEAGEEVLLPAAYLTEAERALFARFAKSEH